MFGQHIFGIFISVRSLHSAALLIVWHQHENEDELFMVVRGTLFIDFKHQTTVEVKEGEIVIIPKGVEHRPRTNGDIVFNLLFEPKSTLHTGDVESDMTVKKIKWI